MHLLPILLLVIFVIVRYDLVGDVFEELNQLLAFVLKLLELIEEASERF